MDVWLSHLTFFEWTYKESAQAASLIAKERLHWEIQQNIKRNPTVKLLHKKFMPFCRFHSRISSEVPVADSWKKLEEERRLLSVPKRFKMSVSVRACSKDPYISTLSKHVNCIYVCCWSLQQWLFHVHLQQCMDQMAAHLLTCWEKERLSKWKIRALNLCKRLKYKLHFCGWRGLHSFLS